jgi:hypothetical protein
LGELEGELMHIGSALVLASILIGASVRVAILLRQEKTIPSTSRR